MSMEIQPLKQETAERFMGGRGFAAHFLLELTERGVDPLGPENVLVFVTGPLAGERKWGSDLASLLPKAIFQPATHQKNRLWNKELGYAKPKTMVNRLKGSRSNDPSEIPSHVTLWALIACPLWALLFDSFCCECVISTAMF